MVVPNGLYRYPDNDKGGQGPRQKKDGTDQSKTHAPSRHGVVCSRRQAVGFDKRDCSIAVLNFIRWVRERDEEYEESCYGSN